MTGEPEHRAALLLAEIGGRSFMSGQNPYKLLVYVFERAGQGFVLLHATKPGDRRYKGHKGVLSTEQFQALVAEILAAESLMPRLILQGNAVRLVLSERGERQYGISLLVSSDLKRDSVPINAKLSSVLPEVLHEIDRHAETIRKLAVVTLDL